MELQIKAIFQGDVRRFLLQRSDKTFEELQNKLYTLYKLNDAILKWKDEEGDLVTFGSEEELLFALRCITGNHIPLRVTVCRVKEHDIESPIPEPPPLKEEAEQEQPANPLRREEIVRYLVAHGMKPKKLLKYGLVPPPNQGKVKGGKGCDGPGRNVARFVKHVTFPDGSSVPKDSPLTKVWRLVNNSKTVWPTDVNLIFVGGDCFNAPADGVKVRGSVKPGQQIDIGVDLQAPSQPGLYQGFFRLCSPVDLKKFGQRLWISVIVTEEVSTTTEASGEEVPTPDAPASAITDDDTDNTDADFVEVPTDVKEACEDATGQETSSADAPAFAHGPHGGGPRCGRHPPRAPGPAPGCQQPLLPPKWRQELVVLSEMGYNNTAKNVRLLNKFSGNVERVVNKLCKQEAKAEAKASKFAANK